MPQKPKPNSSSNSIKKSPLINNDNNLKKNGAEEIGSENLSLAQLAGRSQLDFEIDFYGAILSRHSAYLEMLRCQVRNLLLKKRFSESLQLALKMLQLVPDSYQVHFQLMVLYSLLQQKEKAIEHFCKAVDGGFRDFSLLQKERDLAWICNDPRIRHILAEYIVN